MNDMDPIRITLIFLGALMLLGIRERLRQGWSFKQWVNDRKQYAAMNETERAQWDEDWNRKN